MREAPPSAVKNKKRATRGSPQDVTRRSKRHAATPQGPVDSAARRDNQQSNGGQDLAGGISPPAGRLLRARKPAPAASDPWEDLTRRRMAGAVMLVHKCGADEKNLRNKDQFKDRNAILALFRTKLGVFQEAGATG